MKDLPKLTLVGVCGRAGSGKDTVANYLCKRYQNTYSEHFADPLKQCASHAFGIPLEAFSNRDLKEVNHPYWGVSPRKIAQFMGTEMFRQTIHALLPETNSDFWVERMHGRLSGDLILPVEQHDEGEYADGDCVIIADVRFQNEINWLYDVGGVIIRLTRPAESGTVGIPSHASEKISELDFTGGKSWLINNGGTLEELARQVRYAVEGLQLGLKVKPDAIGISDL